MGDEVGELTVVGEQQEALRIGIEPPYGIDPRLGRHEVRHDGTTLRIGGRADHPDGLVEQVVDAVGVGGKRHAVDRDAGRGRIDLHADRGHDPVDRDASSPDQHLGLAARGIARPGDQLVEPLDGASGRNGRSRLSSTDAGGT